MSQFLSKFTPLGPHMVLTVGGGVDLLSFFVPGGIPHGATGVWMQCAQPGEVLLFGLNGLPGSATPFGLEYPGILELTNGPQLRGCWLNAPSDIQVQFFTGSAGGLF